MQFALLIAIVNVYMTIAAKRLLQPVEFRTNGTCYSCFVGHNNRTTTHATGILLIQMRHCYLTVDSRKLYSTFVSTYLLETTFEQFLTNI